jgi:hypothetical protein
MFIFLFVFALFKCFASFHFTLKSNYIVMIMKQRNYAIKLMFGFFVVVIYHLKHLFLLATNKKLK